MFKKLENISNDQYTIFQNREYFKYRVATVTKEKNVIKINEKLKDCLFASQSGK